VKERCKELRKESGIVLEIVEREALKVGKDLFSSLSAYFS